MPRGVLFVHNNFPGQFRDLAQTLIARGVPCIAVGQDHAVGMPGVRMAKKKMWVRHDKAAGELGYRPAAAAVALGNAVAWFREKGYA